MVQLREKDMPGGRLLELAHRLREVTSSRALFIVNERVDIAMAAEADGVQLGEDAMPVEAARKLAPQALMGRSVHDPQGAAEAEQVGADFLVVGTIFSSPSHEGGAASGPQLVGEIRAESGLPVLGIGGVTAGNVGEVMNGGAHGVAVISALLAADSPEKAAQTLVDSMEKAVRNSPEAVPARGATGRQ